MFMSPCPRGDILIETANRDSPGEINYRPRPDDRIGEEVKKAAENALADLETAK